MEGRFDLTRFRSAELDAAFGHAVRNTPGSFTETQESILSEACRLIMTGDVSTMEEVKASAVVSAEDHARLTDFLDTAQSYLRGLDIPEPDGHDGPGAAVASQVDMVAEDIPAEAPKMTLERLDVSGGAYKTNVPNRIFMLNNKDHMETLVGLCRDKGLEIPRDVQAAFDQFQVTVVRTAAGDIGIEPKFVSPSADAPLQGELKLSSIAGTHASVAPSFTDGRTVDALVRELVRDPSLVTRDPRMELTVFKSSIPGNSGGKKAFWSMNNRRLKAMQLADRQLKAMGRPGLPDIKVRAATMDEITYATGPGKFSNFGRAEVGYHTTASRIQRFAALSSMADRGGDKL